MPPGASIIIFRRAGSAITRGDLRAFAQLLVNEVAEGKHFECLLTNDSELTRLNRDFLGKNYPTDVLSFPEEGNHQLGSMAISVERAAAQAVEHGHSIDDEVKILMLHGALHLLGMDHESDRGHMARQEKKWRKKLGLPLSLIERASR
jgi:probable rRNA maturation factor